jgi:hypothetical protein
VQSPCDGLAKAIQHYRKNHSQDHEELALAETALNHGSVPAAAIQNAASQTAAKASGAGQSASVELFSANSNGARAQAPCGKCGGAEWLKIDGCNVCQSCGYSKCG